MMRIVHVDQNGIDKDGNDYNFYATEDAINRGLAKNRPVRLRFPDGLSVVANEVVITPKGLEDLKRKMVLEGGAS